MTTTKGHTVNTAAATSAVAAAHEANRDRPRSEFWKTSALLDAVAAMIQRLQYDAAYWTASDILEAELDRVDEAFSSDLIDTLYTLTGRLDGLRNGF
jgi:hypothetical protein